MEEHFTNDQILIDTVPSLDNVVYEKVESRYFRSIMISISIFFVILLVALGVCYFYVPFVKSYWLYFLIIILVCAAVSYYVEYMGFAEMGFALRDKDILYKEGFLFKSVMAVPFNRIQHCQINQGPIDRLFNLSSITIYTAGGSTGDLEISGLLPENAQKIKAFIINKSSVVDEEE